MPFILYIAFQRNLKHWTKISGWDMASSTVFHSILRSVPCSKIAIHAEERGIHSSGEDDWKISPKSKVLAASPFPVCWKRISRDENTASEFAQSRAISCESRELDLNFSLPSSQTLRARTNSTYASYSYVDFFTSSFFRDGKGRKTFFIPSSAHTGLLGIHG